MNSNSIAPGLLEIQCRDLNEYRRVARVYRTHDAAVLRRTYLDADRLRVYVVDTPKICVYQINRPVDEEYTVPEGWKLLCTVETIEYDGNLQVKVIAYFVWQPHVDFEPPNYVKEPARKLMVAP